MNIEFLKTLINEVGLSAAGLVVLGYFIYKLITYIQNNHKETLEIIRHDNREDKENLRLELGHNREVNKAILECNQELTETNRSLVDKFEGRMENIEDTLVKIDTKVDKVLKKK